MNATAGNILAPPLPLDGGAVTRSVTEGVRPAGGSYGASGGISFDIRTRTPSVARYARATSPIEGEV